MKRLLAWAAVAAWTLGAQASWYWPFGEDEDPDIPKLSVIMEPASTNIDYAADCAAEGDVDEAVAAYRRALSELEMIELRYPDRAATPEFASVRNKRAYVNAAIDSLLLSQARKNAKAVAITDTTELERKMANSQRLADEKRERLKAVEERRHAAQAAVREGKEGDYEKPDEIFDDPAEDAAMRALRAKEKSERREKLARAGRELSERNFQTALSIANELLEKDESSIPALNLKALCKAQLGEVDAAEEALNAALKADPADYHAYYNMANLLLLTRGGEGVFAARRFYRAGRAQGGPADAALESALK